MKQQAQNTFTDGLIMDYHPLSCKNTVLTDALNATIITTRGNEMVLQNDLGNEKIVNEFTDCSEGTELKAVQLKDGYVPIGIKEHHGVLYIVSYNGECGEIGTYPSPNYDEMNPQASATEDSEAGEQTLPMV